MRFTEKIKSLSFFLFFILLTGGFLQSCSDDSEYRPILVDNTDDNDDDDDVVVDDDQPSDATSFTYTATANLKVLASYPIGMIVSANRLTSNSSVNQTFRSILNDEYNSITAENDMKMANQFINSTTYDFSDGDVIVAYAKANNLRVHGHALVWHSSIPGWLNNFSGTDAEFETLIENYIKATVTHFAQETFSDGTPVVASWDVVNEAFDGSADRNSLFRQRLGNDYVEKCFRWAREADPNVKLFYNDYNVAGEPGKRNAIINMANTFVNNGVPIDGIGMQFHVNHDWPNDTELFQSVADIAGTGLLVHISELDVKVNYNNSITEMSLAIAGEQEDRYEDVGQAYSNVPAAQQFGITIWGMRDQESWLWDGGTEWPLMYDNNFDTKVAHRGFAAGLD